MFPCQAKAVVRIQEAESLVVEDRLAGLEQFAVSGPPAPDSTPRPEPDGQFLTVSTEAIPLVAGRLALGRRQRLVLLELDRPRLREVQVQILVPAQA